MNNKFSKEARKASSGSIPKDLAPQIEPYNPIWTAELWEYFANHHYEVSGMRMYVASSSASYITFYDPKGKENFNRVAAAARRFWHLWSSSTLKLTKPGADGTSRECDRGTAMPVWREDGGQLEIPMPASMKSLGLKRLEGFGIALLKQMDFPMEMVANDDMN